MTHMKELREMLCDELKEIVDKGDLSGMLDAVDKLTHSIKSIDTIIAMEEAGYSNDYYNRHSYERRRDDMGRYSRTRSRDSKEHIVEKIEDMMQDTQDHKVKEALRKVLQVME